MNVNKGSSVVAAFKVFPKPVFLAWLRMRTRAADYIDKNWREFPVNQYRVKYLDASAAWFATLN